MNTRARYLFRMDDIAPSMNWRNFWRVIDLFERYQVKPLLGIIPDNHDERLHYDPPAPDFWEVMRSLSRRGAVEVAQHGYRHTLQSRPGAGILSRRFGLRDFSEFAGDPFESQLERIILGKQIMNREGLSTSYWIAPNHSFDASTLKALGAAGFTGVSDGISLYPYKKDGLTFVPQQFWRPYWMPFGVFTICLHSNSIKDQEILEIKKSLDRGLPITSFSREVARFRETPTTKALDRAFEASYYGIRRVQRMTSGKTLRC